MWTRAELKQRAMGNLKRYFLAAFIVSMIFELLSGNSGSSSNGANTNPNVGNGFSQEYNFNIEVPGGVEGFLENAPQSGEYLFDSLTSALHSVNPLVWSILAGAMVVIVLVSAALSIFVLPAMEVGRNRFYMESRGFGTSAGVSKLFWGFNRNYLNIIWTMFLKNLLITLGTICFVFPGIYLTYCFYMVPFILAENPDMKARDVLNMSKDMMAGHKINTFVLEISFIGWWILGALTFGIGTYFVQPYHDATFAELYAVLRQRFSYVLNGFGYPDYGPGGNYGDNYGDGGSYNGGYGGGYQGGYNDGTYNNGDYYNGSYHNGYEQSGYYQEPAGNDDPMGNGGSAGTGGYAGYAGWQQTGNPYMQQGAQGDMNASVKEQSGTDGMQDDRDLEVKRSEGGPGRGYYLNGEFHPYTEDELNQLDKK